MTAIRKKACVLIAAAICLSLVLGQAALAAETTEYAGTAGYLDMGMDARIIAMGGASVALPGGATSVNYNPAALGGMKGSELASSYAQDYGMLQEGAVALRLGPLAVGALYAGASGIPEKDEFGNKIGEFDYKALAAMAGCGLKLGPLAVGAQATYAKDTLGSTEGSGLTASAGAQLQLGVLRLGAAGYRLIGAMTYGDKEQAFSPRYVAGAAIVTKVLTLTGECEIDADQNKLLRGGGELSLGSIALRGGAKYDMAEEEMTLSMGAGLNLGGAKVDYAYVMPANMPITHRISIGIAF